MNYCRIQDRSSDCSAQILWQKYSDFSWGNDADLIHFAQYLDRITDCAHKKFSMLFRMLQSSCERKNWEIELTPSTRFTIGFYSARVSSEEMYDLEALKHMAKIVRRRSLHIFWHAIRISNSDLNRFNLKSSKEIRRFFRNPENSYFLNRIKKISCRMTKHCSLTFFPRELIALRGLKELDIQNFGFIFLPNRFFQNFFSLRSVNLNNNLLVDWSMNKRSLPNLKKLSLASNQIMNCRVWRLAKCVMEIDLRHNPISRAYIHFLKQDLRVDFS